LINRYFGSKTVPNVFAQIFLNIVYIPLLLGFFGVITKVKSQSHPRISLCVICAIQEIIFAKVWTIPLYFICTPIILKLFRTSYDRYEVIIETSQFSTYIRVFYVFHISIHMEHKISIRVIFIFKLSVVHKHLEVQK